MTFDFPSVTKQDWLKKIEADLKGKTMSSLDWKLSDECLFSPFASKEDIEDHLANLATIGHNHWHILERIDVRNENKANELGLDALQGGATAIQFHIKDNCDFSKLLKDINLEWIYVHTSGDEVAAEQFSDFLKQSSFCKEKINGFVEKGGESFSAYPSIRTLEIKATNEKQTDEKIATLLIEIAKQLLDHGPDQVSKLCVSLKLTDSFYINIAEIRAFKILHQLLLRGFGFGNKAPFIRSNMICDKTNADYAKIQAASQAMAAAIGGADCIYIPPTGEKNSQDFHRRIARNVHHLLQLESFMNRVEDPAAGSYYLELLTDSLAASAWKKFQLKYENL